MKHIFYILILIILVIVFGIAVKRHHYGQQTTSCLSVRKVLLAQTPKTTDFVPQCTIFGNYILQQCNPDTRQCWCVTQEGKKIAGTDTEARKASAACPISWFDRFYRDLQ